MSRKKNLELLSEDISSFLSERRNGLDSSTILDSNLSRLKKVYDTVPKIKQFIDALSNSSQLNEIDDQNKFFAKYYFEYLKNSSTCNPIPQSIQNIDHFCKINSSDSYFKFKDIYDYIFSEKSKNIKKAYNLHFPLSIRDYYSKGKYQFECSVCQQHICIGTRDLDHFLPKQFFPILCLRHFNIVPMCIICNRQFKKTNLPETPILHPYKDGFPIKLIPMYLSELNVIKIKKQNLSPECLNYINLMSLDKRLHHVDIKRVVVELTKEVEVRTEKRIKEDITQKRKLQEIVQIIKEEIGKYKYDISSSGGSFKIIKLKVLDSMLQDIDLKSIAAVLHRRNY